MCRLCRALSFLGTIPSALPWAGVFSHLWCSASSCLPKCMTRSSPLVLTVALAACCLVPLPAQTPAPLPRLAIVPGSEDKELSTLADLLIVSMAHASQRFEMVERAELKRLEQEAELQRMNIAERPRAL